MSWLTQTGRRWFDLVAGVASLASIVAFAVTTRYTLAWVAIGVMFLLVVSFVLTAREEHQRRVTAEEATHQPPGGGIPLYAPTEYQVDALRQVAPRLAEAMDTFGFWELNETLTFPARRSIPSTSHWRTATRG